MSSHVMSRSPFMPMLVVALVVFGAPNRAPAWSGVAQPSSNRATPGTGLPNINPNSAGCATDQGIVTAWGITPLLGRHFARIAPRWGQSLADGPAASP